MKRVLITGGPSSGKTSIIQELEKRGYVVSHEKARQVIKQELAAGTDNLPWQNVAGFSNILLETILQEQNQHPLQFFDRGIPDIEAYLQLANATYNSTLYTQSIQAMNYHTKVFFAPFWLDIYGQDEERKENIEDAIKISNLIKQRYVYHGFELVEIPKDFVENRTEFILSELLLPPYQQS